MGWDMMRGPVLRAWHSTSGFSMRTYVSLVLSLVLVACSEAPEDSDTNVELAPLDSLVAGVDAEVPAGADAIGWSEIQFFGQDGEDAYRLRAGKFTAHLNMDGLQLRSISGDDEVRVASSAWGRPGEMKSLGSRVPAALRNDKGAIAHLQMLSPGIQEWWRGSPYGIQQSWEIAEAPGGKGALSIVLDVEAALVEADGSRIWLDSGGDSVWILRNLHAWDAEKTVLDAWFEVEDSRIVIRVDDADATYPVTIDPWYSSYGTEIRHESSGTSDPEGYIQYSNLTGERCYDTQCYNSYFAQIVRSLGDTNGDGYDDFLIGAYGADDGGDDAGQTYLILGKTSGWAMDTDLSDVDASFIGEDAGVAFI